MWPDRVSNPGPLTYESGALSTALRGLAFIPCNRCFDWFSLKIFNSNRGHKHCDIFADSDRQLKLKIDS